VSDFNKDGYLDMILTNIDSLSLAYINEGGENNSIQVNLGDNAKSLGARVVVETSKGVYTDWLATGEGLASDQTSILHFGLGKQTEVSKVIVYYVDGTKEEVINPNINSILVIGEIEG
jgi:hypothetical protein